MQLSAVRITCIITEPLTVRYYGFNQIAAKMSAPFFFPVRNVTDDLRDLFAISLKVKFRQYDFYAVPLKFGGNTWLF